MNRLNGMSTHQEQLTVPREAARRVGLLDTRRFKINRKGEGAMPYSVSQISAAWAARPGGAFVQTSERRARGERPECVFTRREKWNGLLNPQRKAISAIVWPVSASIAIPRSVRYRHK